MRATIVVVLAVLLTGCFAGCAAEVHQRSQDLQLAAVIQYSVEMKQYHGIVTDFIRTQKETELDAALQASLAMNADATGNVPIAKAMERVQAWKQKRADFAANMARFDSQFQERQNMAARIIRLGEKTSEVLNSYTWLETWLRGLVVREPEIAALTRTATDLLPAPTLAVPALGPAPEPATAAPSP